jgi:hypothetical protein
VRAAGAQVVFRARQTFVPAGGLHLVIKVRFYHVVFVARDALFGFPTGRSIELTHPDGRVQRLELGSDGVASLGPLVRGQYRVKVEGAAMGGPQPLALSRDQDVSLTVVTLLDLATASAALLVLAVSILLLGRPHLRRGIRTKVRRGLPGPRRTVEQVRR